ncbi:hypothetical protein HDV00_012711 [Rhizophlyctis rosea]|nr:hypothetical protein HDV00_012711 [Rhizophlyctis rosea]
MKDPSASLAKYGVKTGSKIFMMGDGAPIPTKPPPPRPNPQPAQPASSQTPSPESTLLATIQKHVDHTRQTLVPMVEQYSNTATTFLGAASNVSASSITPKQLKDEHAKVSELLLQSLLKLDGVVCPPELEVARAARKEAVRFVPPQLPRLDRILARVTTAVRDRGLVNTP